MFGRMLCLRCGLVHLQITEVSLAWSVAWPRMESSLVAVVCLRRVLLHLQPVVPNPENIKNVETLRTSRFVQSTLAWRLR